uniref:(northern house mosquito) hypothetical protein n=1 Tax=Culex pipiens TaxID=7175 RepID=A0A8D8FVC6_CULPI
MYVCVLSCAFWQEKKASFNKQLPYSVSVFALNARAHAYARKQFWHILFLIHVVFFLSRTHIFAFEIQLYCILGFEPPCVFISFQLCTPFPVQICGKIGYMFKILTKLLNGCINFGISVEQDSQQKQTEKNNNILTG